jgi:hypothetical protein
MTRAPHELWAQAYREHPDDPRACKNRYRDLMEQEGHLLRHNHFTRDIKHKGQCPACDAWHEQQRMKERP